MTVNRWEVWLANLDPVVGSEQGRTRPVLILSETAVNSVLPVVNTLPITSRKQGRRIYPNEALIPAGEAGLNLESIVLCYQIRTLDKTRLIALLGTLDDSERQKKILEALRLQLGMR